MRAFTVLLAFLLAAASGAGAADLRTEVERYRRAHETEIVDQLADLTRIDSVAASPSGLTREADALLALLKARIRMSVRRCGWVGALAPPPSHDVAIRRAYPARRLQVRAPGSLLPRRAVVSDVSSS